MMLQTEKYAQGASQLVLLLKSSDEMYIPRVPLHPKYNLYKGWYSWNIHFITGF